MGEKFKVAIACIILAIFAFPAVAFLRSGGAPSQWSSFKQWLCVVPPIFLFALFSLISILGILRGKAWAKWTALAVLIIPLTWIALGLVYSALLHDSLDDIPESPKQPITPPSFVKNHPMIQFLYKFSMPIGISIFGIAGIILIVSINRKLKQEGR